MRATSLPLLACCILALAGRARAGVVEREATPEGVVLHYAGKVEKGDAGLLRDAMRAVAASGSAVRWLTLSSVGGLVGEAVLMAEAVRDGGVGTEVRDGAVCASACFDIFAAGRTKMVGVGARVGVHGAAERPGVETEGGRAATVTEARRLKALGVSDTVVGRMVVTPPSSIAWLTPDDLSGMGVVVRRPDGRGPRPTAPFDLRYGQGSGTGPDAVAALPGAPQSREDTAARVAAFRADGRESAWTGLLNRAMAAGPADRKCAPSGPCVDTYGYVDDDGLPSTLAVRTDAGGRTLSRSRCTMNAERDFRECLDVDTEARIREYMVAGRGWSSAH